MARIRSIKPSFFTNEDLSELPYQWRLLFIGLWTQADRAGRLEDRPKRLKAELFPYDDLDVNEGLGCLANAGFITRYDANGVRLIAVPTWTKHQQPNVKESSSLLPPPPINGIAGKNGEHGAGTVLAPQEGKGTDQEGKGTVPDALRARFERFWATYPRKVGKDAAWAIWERKRPGDDLTNRMITAVQQQTQSAQWQREDGKYIPHPRTWLNQGRWQDEPEPPPEPGGESMRGLREFARGR